MIAKRLWKKTRYIGNKCFNSNHSSQYFLWKKALSVKHTVEEKKRGQATTEGRDQLAGTEREMTEVWEEGMEMSLHF